VFARNRVVLLAAVGIVLGAGISTKAQDLKSAGKTVITSDTLMFDYGRSTCVFEGNVVVTEPQVSMTCDKLYVFFDATNSVDSVVATDSVRVKQGDRTGSSDKAVYTAETGAIVMTGNATLTRGRDSISGDEITIYVNSEKVTCTPGRLVVFPSSLETSGGGPQ
jgi:lipopolysaccharide export system protein LptA